MGDCFFAEIIFHRLRTRAIFRLHPFGFPFSDGAKGRGYRPDSRLIGIIK